MNRLEGRVAVGLDEFMLRVGHLKVITPLAGQVSGNRMRLARNLASRLSEPEEIDPSMLPAVGEYLRRKRLSVVIAPDGKREEPQDRARYKELEVLVGSDDHVVQIVARAGETPRVWFQDRCIADPRTRSKVGAVTVETREITNKSGVSHLVDWGVILGLLNRRLGLTAVGRALLALCEVLEHEGLNEGSNPYILGAERVVIGWLLIRADGDVLARLLRLLAELPEVRKQGAVDTMLRLHDELRADVGRVDRVKSFRVANRIRTLSEDLGIGRGASRVRGGPSSSTVWHRMSSRLESLTDLGFLEKVDASGKPREFDYCYRATAQLKTAVATASDEASPSEWAADHLVESLAGDEVRPGQSCGREIREGLRLAMGPTGVHIESFAVLTAALAFARGKRLSIGDARSRLLRLASQYPEVVRLSRGYTGEGAEFASINLKALEQIGVEELETPC